MVPAMAGVQVNLTPIAAVGAIPAPDAKVTTLPSDADGYVRFSIAQEGAYHLEVMLPWSSPDPGIKSQFSRWMDNVFTPARDIEYNDGALYQAGFEIHYLVGYQFTNLQGKAIDPAEITSVTLKNTMGEKITRTETGQFWVKGGRVTRRHEGLEETQLQYSIEEVIVDGTNVVNRAQNRFIPAETRSWTIPLLYYSMTFTSQDALFAFPAGTSAEVTSPNGTVRVVQLDSSGTASVPLLPRGEYHVRILGGGYSPETPVALSRDQTVELKVISVTDAAFVGGIGGAVALGLLLIGRWRLMRDKLRVLAPWKDRDLQSS